MMRRCSAVRLLALLVALAAPAVAEAEPDRVEVAPFDNTSSLPSADVAVLDSLVLSALSELPVERFSVVAFLAPSDPACEKACRIAAAKARGAGRVVMGSIAAFGDGFLAALEAYDTSTGQLLGSASTGAVPMATDLPTTIKSTAVELRSKIDPHAAVSSLPAGSVPTTSLATVVDASAPANGAPAPVTAMLRVYSQPPGARVYTRRGGFSELIGTTPVEKILLPVEYRVWVELSGYQKQSTYVRLDPFELEAIRFDLVPELPISPGLVAGHAAFWTGVGVVGFGFLAMGQALAESRSYERTLESAAKENTQSWTGGMWASFGVGAALMATGAVLWAVSPTSEELWKRNYGGGVAPTPDGGAVATFGRRF